MKYELNNTWKLDTHNANGLAYIAGPCSAESEEMLMQTAQCLKNAGLTAFRAGIWKPRTRPGSFEGMGETALPWLKNVKREFNIPIATEVATPKHVELALKYDLDLLWIGARTSANPFLMQELSNSLRGVDIPVLVKNPINPDLNLWLGAIERMLSSGLTRVGAILRGFSTQHPGELRNDPGWHIAIDFRQKMQGIPLLCDPSHISGRRDMLQQLSQQALNLDFDGLMIETHPNPDTAKSDASQQITPEALIRLLNSLQMRQRSTPNDIKLEALRTQIDELDYEILAAIAKRMTLVKEIGDIKKDQNLTVLQSQRWAKVLDNMLISGKKLSLPLQLVETLAKLLHNSAIETQQELFDRK